MDLVDGPISMKCGLILTLIEQSDGIQSVEFGIGRLLEMNSSFVANDDQIDAQFQPNT
jgi:hypothetical protein